MLCVFLRTFSLKHFRGYFILASVQNHVGLANSAGQPVKPIVIPQAERMVGFSGKKDRFNGIKIDTTPFSYTPQEFEKLLKESLSEWMDNGTRGVWFKVLINHSFYVPVLVEHGFEYHHAKASYVMMTRWLPKNEPNLLPPYPHTYIGVAGLVINEMDEILVVKEKYHTKPHWKFPGGYANPGEEFADTAKREVEEETGVKCDFVSVVGQRHRHNHLFGSSDLYIVCHMKALSYEITICKNEISDCKWMPLREYMEHPEAIALNRIMISSYLKSKESKIVFGTTEIEPPFSTSHNLQNVYHIQ